MYTFITTTTLIVATRNAHYNQTDCSQLHHTCNRYLYFGLCAVLILWRHLLEYVQAIDFANKKLYRQRDIKEDRQMAWKEYTESRHVLGDLRGLRTKSVVPKQPRP